MLSTNYPLTCTTFWSIQPAEPKKDANSELKLPQKPIQNLIKTHKTLEPFDGMEDFPEDLMGVDETGVGYVIQVIHGVRFLGHVEAPILLRYKGFECNCLLTPWWHVICIIWLAFLDNLCYFFYFLILLGSLFLSLSFCLHFFNSHFPLTSTLWSIVCTLYFS